MAKGHSLKEKSARLIESYLLHKIKHLCKVNRQNQSKPIISRKCLKCLYRINNHLTGYHKMQRGSEKLYQEIEKCKKITNILQMFFSHISDRIEKKEMEVDGREPASETTETSETIEEVTDEIEAEQTQREEHFETEQLPCFDEIEAEQTQRENILKQSNYLVSKQSKQKKYQRRQCSEYLFVSYCRSYIETVASFCEQERFVYIIYSLLKSSECIVCYCLLCECHVLYISLDGNSYVDTIKIC